MSPVLSDRHTKSGLFSWYHLLVLCSIPLTALLIDFGRVHDDHNGDSLIPILMSLHQWTPFYWDQTRFGMLVPLLAKPITDPFANLIFQVFLCSLAGVSVPFLLARYLFPARMTFVIGAAANSVYFMSQSLWLHFHMLMGSDQPYSVGMCVTLLGILLLEPGTKPRASKRRRTSVFILAFVLVLLGTWVNIGIIFSLGPLILFRTLHRLFIEPHLRVTASMLEHPDSADSSVHFWTARIEPWYGLITLVSCVVIFVVLSHWVPNSSNTKLFNSPEHWARTWSQLAIEFYKNFLPVPTVLSLMLISDVGLIGSVIRRSDILIRESAAASLLLIFASLASWLLIGTLHHVEENQCAPRYLTDAFVMLNLACVGLAVCVLFLHDKPYIELTRSWGNPLLHVVSAVFLVTSCVFRFEAPNLSRVYQSLERQFGKNVEAVERIRATHVAGSYWTVWPTMFFYETRKHESDMPKVVWGIAHRADATKSLFLPAPGDDVRIAVKSGESKEAEYHLRRLDMWPCERSEVMDGFEVWRFKNDIAAFDQHWGSPADGRPLHWCDQWGTLSIRSSVGGPADLVLNLETRNWPVLLTAKLDTAAPVSVKVEQGGFHTVVFRDMPILPGLHSLRLDGMDLKNAQRRPWITIESGYFQIGSHRLRIE